MTAVRALPQFRAAALALPSSLLMTLNFFRVPGVLFLCLERAGRLSGPFPFSAVLGLVPGPQLGRAPVESELCQCRITPQTRWLFSPHAMLIQNIKSVNRDWEYQ